MERTIALIAGESGSGKSFAVACLKHALIYDTDLGGAMRTKKESQQRIDRVRGDLIGRGWRCLRSGKFGLPSYTHVEAWSKSGAVVYLLYHTDDGSWDMLYTLDQTNDTQAAWDALDKLPTFTAGTDRLRPAR